MEINGKCQHLIKDGLCFLVGQSCVACTDNEGKTIYQKGIADNCPGTDLTEMEREDLVAFRTAGYLTYRGQVAGSENE
jgi:hypothetical protein